MSGLPASGKTCLADRVLAAISNTASADTDAEHASVLLLELLNLASTIALSRQAARVLYEIRELYAEYLSVGLSPWREPELFQALYRLVSNGSNSDWTTLQTIKFHLDRSLELPASELEQYLRSPVLRSAVYYYDSSGWKTINLRRLRDGGPVLIPAEPHLFADMLDEIVYPNINVDADDVTRSKLNSGLELIGRFDPALLRDILATVTVIALVGGLRSPGFSCRTRYYGGIFVDPGYENGNVLVETIIHEYIHLKLWLQWTIEPISTHAALVTEIESPMTGRRRQAGVMLHAYLIYAQCIEYYTWAMKHDFAEDRKWCSDRLKWLTERTPVLRDALQKVFIGDTANKMVQAIHDEIGQV